MKSIYKERHRPAEKVVSTPSPHLSLMWPMEGIFIVGTNGDSEFLKAVDGRKADKVWKLIDELVEAVKVLHPRMYTTFIDKVQDL